MIIEHAEFTIAPSDAEAFEAAFLVGREAIAQASGYHWSRLVRQIEDPGKYLLLIGWESLEAHMVDFRGSELFTRWRAAVGPYFAEAPVLTHYQGGLEPAQLD